MKKVKNLRSFHRLLNLVVTRKVMLILSPSKVRQVIWSCCLNQSWLWLKNLFFAEAGPVVISTLDTEVTEATIHEDAAHDEESTKKDVNLDEVKESEPSVSNVEQEDQQKLIGLSTFFPFTWFGYSWFELAFSTCHTMCITTGSIPYKSWSLDSDQFVWPVEFINPSNTFFFTLQIEI